MNDFENQAVLYLKTLFTLIEGRMGDTLEVDFVDPCLTITFEDDHQILIHIHRQNHEIWLSSPLTGASHFHFDSDTNAWVIKRGDQKLEDILLKDIYTLTGRTL